MGTHKQGHIAKASNQLSASDVIVLSLEEILKTSHLRVINKFVRQKLGGKIMCTEEYVRSKMKEVSGGIEFTEFDEKVLGKIITYRYKNIDEVLSKFLIDNYVFNDCSMMKHISIAISGDYGKGLFAMMLSACVELKNEVGGTFMDEVLGKIDSIEEKVDMLKPLTI